MSKYIQLLLQHRSEIKSSRLNSDWSEEDTLYDDLLTVEQKITELYHKKLLTDIDIKLLKYISSNKSLRNLAIESGISRTTLTKRFVAICNRLSFYLGHHFTNSGYIETLRKKYNLTDEQVNILTKKLL